MNTLTPSDYATPEQIARNHSRVAAFTVRSQVRDMFAEHGGEDLQLIGESMPQRVERATADIQAAEPQLGFEF